MKNCFLLFASMAITGALCAQNPALNKFKTHKNGVKCHYIKTNPSGDNIQHRDIVIGNFSIAYGDSVVHSTFGQNPQPCFQASATQRAFRGDLMDGLLMMKVGEECVFAFPYDSMEKVQSLPPFFKKEDHCFFTVKITARQTEDELRAEEVKREAEQKKIQDSVTKVEVATINKYIHENEKKALTINNIYFINDKEGMGEKPQQGQTVKVNYIGRLLDGKLFDTSVDTVARAENKLQEGRSYEPISFTIGARQMIQGFETGVLEMKKGGVATIIIPSEHGYGSRNMGDIPPYSVLVFTIELVEIQ